VSTLAALVVVLGVLVFIHEAGHFLAAKWAGIWVHRFSLGFGSPIPGLHFTRRGTEYCIAWLPLGGYVKMAIREEEATTSALEGGAVLTPVPEGTYYEDKPVWKRIVVTLAGVTMNVVFAWVVFVCLAARNGRQVIPETRIGRVATGTLPAGAEALGQLRPGDRITAVNGHAVHSWDEVTTGILTGAGSTLAVTVNDSLSVVVRIPADAVEQRANAAGALAPWQPAVVDLVQPSWPAARAGMEPGDTVVAVDGKPVLQWYDLVDLLQASPGRALTLEVARAGGRRTLTLTPDAFDTAGRKIGRIGVTAALPNVIHTPYSALGAVLAGTKATGQSAMTIVRSIQGLLTRRTSVKSLGGPIMIGQVAAASARLGIDAFISVLAIISINLAILNLLPIPVLDGGQLVFLLYESAFRRPMPLRWRERLMLAGLAVIVLLVLVVNWNDVRRLLGW
jgi:regulator of sigma E protease